MTLFLEASATDEDRELFQKVLDKYFSGNVDTRTLAILKGIIMLGRKKTEDESVQIID